jgi:hypothetical protein
LRRYADEYSTASLPLPAIFLDRRARRTPVTAPRKNAAPASTVCGSFTPREI